MISRACAFASERLWVTEWHSYSPVDAAEPLELATVVTAILTEPVTRSLPPAWQGSYTLDRARDWIRERDEQGATLLVVDKTSGDPMGLVILAETPAATGIDGVEVRLGYLLAEPAWGKGLASELIAGVVAWCRRRPEISAIAGGVASDNPASKRVLEKNGFVVSELAEKAGGDEEIMRLNLAG